MAGAVKGVGGDPRVKGDFAKETTRAYVAEVRVIQFSDGVSATHHLVAPDGCAFAVDHKAPGVVRVGMYGPGGEAAHMGSVTFTDAVTVIDGLMAQTWPNMPPIPSNT
jgi:hypothetical protein